jgi:hypothetical protein
MARALLALPLALAALFAAEGASAQASVVVLAPYTPPPVATVLKSATAPSDTSALPPDAASLPLRLSLLTGAYPLGPAFGTVGACGELSVAAAGTIFPTQPYTQMKLTPRLVLHGFSDLGCPGDPYALLDTGAGGGLTYSLPLRPGMWLVGSAGAYVIPAHDTLPARNIFGGGLDVAVKSPKQGNVLTTGIGVSTRGSGVRVIPRIGGTF